MKTDKPNGLPAKEISEAPIKRFGGLKDAFSPNRILSPVSMQIIIGAQILILLALWFSSPYAVLPKPGEVVAELGKLWTKQGLGQELIRSFELNIKALLMSAVISIGLSYLTVLPFFRPIITVLSKGRFLSLVGFSVFFTLVLGGGEVLKLSLLVFSMTVFFLTSMASVVAEIPKETFDYARTLRMRPWRIVWEVVILGTAAEAFEAMRQNAAIGWMMLTMVEGIVRSGGGVGVLLLNNQKYMNYAAIYAIQIVILLVGIFQDTLIGFARRIFCPYSVLALERR